MTIHLISFASILHKQVSLRSSHEAILSEIEKYYPFEEGKIFLGIDSVGSEKYDRI